MQIPDNFSLEGIFLKVVVQGRKRKEWYNEEKEVRDVSSRITDV